MIRFSCISLLFVLLSQALLGQKMPSDYFEEGEKQAEAHDYKNAAVSFQYIVTHYPKNSLYPRAFYNAGYCYFMDKQTENAVSVFKSILTSNFNEQENAGRGLMGDPYANYRHRASEVLSEIYDSRKDYDSALYYFALSDTAFPYLHFCGNEYAANDIHTALRYADLYEKMGNRDKAIEVLLPAAFITLSDNSEVISRLKLLLNKKKKLKTKLDAALEQMYPKQDEDDDYPSYYFKFLNLEIAVPGSRKWDKKPFNKSETIEQIKKTPFYEMIKSL